jgi:hypothetical protein
MVGRPPSSRRDARLAEDEAELNAFFERKWGVVYRPMSLVIVVWLVLMVFWTRL